MAHYRDVEELFHDTWLGEAQPLQGLTFSVPVLCDGGVMVRLSSADAQELAALAPADDHGVHRLVSLTALLTGPLGWSEDELVTGDALPEDLVLRIAEEGTELRPDAAVAWGGAQREPDDDPTASGEQTPASRAGRGFQMLLWELPPGMKLDTAESETSEWHYPPSAKLERLLRETRVPMGLLSNGEVVRLLYCPAGHATGWISFPVAFMVGSGGRDMLSAFRELLHADRVLGGMAEVPTTLELLEQSRERQADVTTKLGGQLLDGLQILLQGFEAAAQRDGDEALREAMEQDGNHVYEGLLTVMLRLVFALAAEDRGLVPAEHGIYAAHLSVGGLYDELQADQDMYADTMEQRFGAWPRLVMLFRALYFGVELPPGVGHEGLSMPPHRGRLFNPENYAFLEGGSQAGGVAVSPEERARTRVPSISDGVVLRILRRLLYLDGQRLSYSALEEEQLGSVYEGLMGYAIERRYAPSVCVRPSRVWVSPAELLEQPKATRVAWLKNAGVPDSAAKRIAKAIEGAVKEAGKDADASAVHQGVMAVLRKESIAPRGKRAARRGEDVEEAEVAAGRLVIQPGEERRRTSSHYTPRSLSGPIVARTLEPLLAAMRVKAKEEEPGVEDPQPSSEALLSLKVCDPAMGSGAFLVEACRFLAKQVEAAWVREGKLAQMVKEADEGDVVKRDPLRLAQRMVAQRCLYGVDKNPLAVELGKLSLWLLTLSQGQTFAFLDHCLKAGDSLVGLNRSQILAMDWSSEDPAGEQPAQKGKGKGKGKKGKGKGGDDRTLDLFAEQTRRAFAKATLARKKLGDLARQGERGGTEKEQHALHLEAEHALERLRDVADVLLSAFFWPHEEAGKLTPEFLFEGKKPSDKDRQRCLARVRDELGIWLATADEPRMPRALELRRVLVRECIRPLHWHLEFPEVFEEGRADPLAAAGEGKVWMDAVVGNPPFAGKNSITGTNGLLYLEWLTSAYVPSHGNADLSAYFFRRAHWMLGRHGTQGMIATNTIGQGDTRATGLQPLVELGGTIYDATRDMKWPVKGANVSVSIVHVAAGTADHRELVSRLDGKIVDTVNSRLRPKPEHGDPVRLHGNADRSFQGTIVLGNGFLLTRPQREALVASNPRNADRIFPYFGGEEVNTHPRHENSRYTIDFDSMGLEEAGQWPELIGILREMVKPERDKARHSKRPWWLFERPRKELYKAIRPLSRCLACSNVSKHHAFAFVPTDAVLAITLIVFPLPAYAHFGLLQSRIHEHWARLQGSTLEDRLRYTPTDCFETFPFPPASTLAPTAPLEAIAASLYQARADFMLATNQGLTKTYNALKDPTNTTPEVLHLRDLHESLDRAVLSAYDQSHITVPPYCGATPAELEQFEDEVLDFLFERNELLAKQEARAAKRARS